MIGRIMRHEWMLLSREKILYLALPVYALLMAYGVFTGTSWKYFLERSTRQAVELADKGVNGKVAQLDRIKSGQEAYSYASGPRLPAPYARFKGYEMAAKTPSPAAAMAVGQSDVLPSYVKVQWKPMFKQANNDEIENPKNLAIGALDLSFVLIYLYPLLVIALSYNILASERESGTQVLLLSQPVSVHQFVLGKILLRGAIVIGLAAAISVVGLVLANPAILDAAGLWRLACFALILGLYGAFWFGMAVVVNAFGRRSSTNALALLAVWIGLVLLVPGAVNLAAKSLYPLPSRIQLVEALRRGDKVAEQSGGFSRAYRADLMRKSEEDALQASSIDFYRKELPLEEKGEAIARPIFDRFEQQRRAQQNVAEIFKYLSPAAVAQLAFAELANHSAQDFTAFQQSVEQFHTVWREYFYKKVRNNQMLTRAEMIAVPRFHYAPEAASAILPRILASMGSLLLYAAGAMAVGFALLRRYPAAGR